MNLLQYKTTYIIQQHTVKYVQSHNPEKSLCNNNNLPSAICLAIVKMYNSIK